LKDQYITQRGANEAQFDLPTPEDPEVPAGESGQLHICFTSLLSKGQFLYHDIFPTLRTAVAATTTINDSNVIMQSQPIPNSLVSLPFASSGNAVPTKREWQGPAGWFVYRVGKTALTFGSNCSMTRQMI
jgi:hypothetical protein